MGSFEGFQCLFVCLFFFFFLMKPFKGATWLQGFVSSPPPPEVEVSRFPDFEVVQSNWFVSLFFSMFLCCCLLSFLFEGMAVSKSVCCA
jgi:hypothetical protein